jgi:hypothetical protein
MDRHSLLSRCRSGLQAMRRARAVPADFALLPLTDLLQGDAKALGQDIGSVMAGAETSARTARGACAVPSAHLDSQGRLQRAYNFCKTA